MPHARALEAKGVESIQPNTDQVRAALKTAYAPIVDTHNGGRCVARSEIDLVDYR